MFGDDLDKAVKIFHSRFKEAFPILKDGKKNTELCLNIFNDVLKAHGPLNNHTLELMRNDGLGMFYLDLLEGRAEHAQPLLEAQMMMYGLMSVMWKWQISEESDNSAELLGFLDPPELMGAIGSGIGMETLGAVLDSAEFARISDDQNIEEMICPGNSQKIFQAVPRTSLEFLEYSNSLKVRTLGHNFFSHLVSTESVIVFITEADDKSHYLDICLHDSSPKGFSDVVINCLGGYFDSQKRVIRVGKLYSDNCRLVQSSELLQRVFTVLTRFKRVYFANTDTLYMNNFLIYQERLMVSDVQVESQLYS